MNIIVHIYKFYVKIFRIYHTIDKKLFFIFVDRQKIVKTGMKTFYLLEVPRVTFHPVRVRGHLYPYHPACQKINDQRDWEGLAGGGGEDNHQHRGPEDPPDGWFPLGSQLVS